MNADDYKLDDSNDSETTDSGSESVTYVEISSVDHPNAYSVLSQGGAIRKNVDVNDFYASITEDIAPLVELGVNVEAVHSDAMEAITTFFTEGDKQAILEWILTSEENGVDNEALQTFIENHRDGDSDENEDE